MPGTPTVLVVAKTPRDERAEGSPKRSSARARPASAPSPRKRRSPEEARALILAAAQRLLASHGPDAVGLKDVAREAGVSHALVTHYFGTIDGLVDAALEAHATEARGELVRRIAMHPDEGPREWMQHYFEWVNRPLTGRLLAWALVTGRIARDDFFSRRLRGAKHVVDALSKRLDASPRRDVARSDLEFAVVLLLAASHGYALGKHAFWASLGRDSVGEDEDSFFFGRLAELVESTTLPPEKSAEKPPKRPRTSRARRA